MYKARLMLAWCLLQVGRSLAWLAGRVCPVVLAASLVSVQAEAQEVGVDHRWRIVVERDTLAIGPLDDVRLWAGLRAAKNNEVRRCVWELHQQAKEVALLRSALDLSRKSDKANAQLVGDLNEALVQCVDARARAERRAKRRSPFIWGISGLAAGSLATLFLVR